MSTRWELLPLEIRRTEGKPEIQCLAGDCPWRWPLDSDDLDVLGMNVRAAVAHASDRHGGLTRGLAEPAPRPHSAPSGLGVRP